MAGDAAWQAGMNLAQKKPATAAADATGAAPPQAQSSGWGSKLIKGAKALPGLFKHGGKVKKTGLAQVEKGERVLTSAQDKHYTRMKAQSKGKKAESKKTTKR